MLMEQRTRYNLEMHSLVHRPLKRPSLGELAFFADRFTNRVEDEYEAANNEENNTANADQSSNNDDEPSDVPPAPCDNTTRRKSKVMFANGNHIKQKKVEEYAEMHKEMKALDRRKVHKMHTAVRLNEIIIENSYDSQLVLLNLPKPPIRKEDISISFAE
ncbi:unnamed protein product [Anisakis simplex]|uniref:Uncharacterized protein n=1 Tax=Anisakis simplex TaxID=6269 RepID=A0A3P6RND1_ANISI|nr:unnamed protein product [Anisakis simplex]